MSPHAVYYALGFGLVVGLFAGLIVGIVWTDREHAKEAKAEAWPYRIGGPLVVMLGGALFFHSLAGGAW